MLSIRSRYNSIRENYRKTQQTEERRCALKRIEQDKAMEEHRLRKEKTETNVRSESRGRRATEESEDGERGVRRTQQPFDLGERIREEKKETELIVSEKLREYEEKMKRREENRLKNRRMTQEKHVKKKDDIQRAREHAHMLHTEWEN